MLFNMKITELYQKVVGVVITVTGINENDILHSNREECADARYLLVRALSDKLSDKETGGKECRLSVLTMLKCESGV